MRIEMHGQAIALRQPLRQYVERAILFALGRFAERIQCVRVNIADVNGPRGGADKRCRIQVSLRRLGEVVAEDTDERIATAVDHASERAGRATRRTIERRIDGRRRVVPTRGEEAGPVE